MLRRDPLPVLPFVPRFALLRAVSEASGRRKIPANNCRFCQYLCFLLRDIKIIAGLIIGNRGFHGEVTERR